MVRIIASADEPENSPRDAESLALLYSLQPWYQRSLPIVFFLFFLTPVGVLLLWTQRPRRPLLGGTLCRLLLSLLFGGAWLITVIMLDMQYHLDQRFQYWSRQAAAKLEGPATKTPATVTMAQFNRLKLGDPYKVATGVMGTDGTLMWETHLAGVRGLAPRLDTMIYEWSNPDGSAIDLAFQNGVLVKKSTVGLIK